MSEKIRVDGEVPIPKKSLGDLFTRIDDLLELLLKVESAQLQVLKAITGVPAIPTIISRVEIAESNRYDIITLPLDDAREDVAIGLKPKNRVVKYMSWLLVEDVVTYRLNSKGHPSITAAVGAEHENFEIDEVYITNAASAGKTAILWVEWREG